MIYFILFIIFIGLIICFFDKRKFKIKNRIHRIKEIKFSNGISEFHVEQKNAIFKIWHKCKTDNFYITHEFKFNSYKSAYSFLENRIKLYEKEIYKKNNPITIVETNILAITQKNIIE